jgi:hypothetical protein
VTPEAEKQFLTLSILTAPSGGERSVGTGGLVKKTHLVAGRSAQSWT